MQARLRYVRRRCPPKRAVHLAGVRLRYRSQLVARRCHLVKELVRNRGKKAILISFSPMHMEAGTYVGISNAFIVFCFRYLFRLLSTGPFTKHKLISAVVVMF